MIHGALRSIKLWIAFGYSLTVISVIVRYNGRDIATAGFARLWDALFFVACQGTVIYLDSKQAGLVSVVMFLERLVDYQ